MGDYSCSATLQWSGQGLSQHTAMALVFFGDVRLDTAVMHGCHPGTGIFGVNNSKDQWGRFDENSYASRLCLGVDKERGGIVMFEPDMVAGVEFQIMYRSLNLDYMSPRVVQLFANLAGRRPVFATYINCAGRAAGYAGLDLEDALLIQKEINGRVPLLGMYNGVEIASVENRPRSLDWSGVLSIFSVPQ